MKRRACPEPALGGCCGDRGFTLLEVVLALAITAVIMVILYSAMSLAQRSQEKGSDREEIAQSMRIAADRVGWLLRGAYPYFERDEDGEIMMFFEGSAGSVGFVTTSTDPYSDQLADTSGLKWVYITAGSRGITVQQSVYFMAGESEAGLAEYILAPSVSQITFEYLDRDSDGNETWVDSWSGTEKDYLPVMVRARMVIGGEQEDEYDLPPVLSAIRTGGPEQIQSELGAGSARSIPQPK